MNAKKRALGKGLSALLQNAETDNTSGFDANQEIMPVGTISKVPLSMIESNPYQPRHYFDEDALQELAASIKEQGVIQPVTLRKSDNGVFQLVSGERRFKASAMAGLQEIPAYIISATDHGMLEMAIVENIQRENLNPIEVALGYRQLIENYQLTQEMLGERLGKSRSSITNHLRLLNLPGEIQIGLRQNLIGMGHARAMLGIGDVQTQLEVYQDVVEEGLSVRDVEEIVRQLQLREEQSEDETGDKKPRHLVREDILQVQKDLSYLYDTKIKIKTGSGGKGNVVISFGSDEDMNRIISLLKK